MSPYVQQVVDIQKREALRQGDVAQQGLAAQAVGAGGYGGSRMAILEAEQNRNLQQQLGDIQTRGIAAAYEDAQARLAQQRQREFTGSSQFAQLGQVAPQQALKELTAVEAVGAQRQAQSQQGLNIAKQQFQEEQQEEQIFPEQTLQQYQSVIRGFPLAPSTYRQTQTTTPAPSYLQQAAGLGGLGLGVASAFGGFKAKGGLVRRMQGGPVDQNSGLGSIVVKRQAGSLVDLSVEELEKIANNLRVPGSQRAEASKLLQERKRSVTPSPIKKSLSKLNVPAVSPDDVDSSDNSSSPPLITPSPAIGTSNSSKPKAVKPTFGSLASLRETPKSDEYFAKATEILGKREKRILDKMDDPSDKYEYLASLLSGIAGG
jgi:hypothetical protein